MSDQNKSLGERLNAHPHLSERIYPILEMTEDTTDSVRTADEAEEHVIGEMRRLGNEVMRDWAVHKEEQKAEEYLKTGESEKHGKKKSAGTRHSVK